MKAEEFIKDREDARESFDFLIQFSEEYASHVLQEYKKELAEWVLESTYKTVFYGPAIIDANELLTKLKEDE